MSAVPPERLALARARLLRAWKGGVALSVEDLLAADPGMGPAVAELAHLEATLLRLGGQAIRIEDYVRRFPEHAEVLELLAGA